MPFRALPSSLTFSHLLSPSSQVGGGSIAGGTGGAPEAYNRPGPGMYLHPSSSLLTSCSYFLPLTSYFSWPAFGPAGGKRQSHKKVATDFMSFLDHDIDVRGHCWYTSNELLEAFNRSNSVQTKGSWHEFVEAINHEGLITFQNHGGTKMYRPTGGKASAMSMHGSQRHCSQR